ncbi:GntR family transcriptional regulator, partial [Streptomyces sp. DT225]
LWNGHAELVAAITHRDGEALRAAIDGYNGHALSWADRLAGRGPSAGDTEGRT